MQHVVLIGTLPSSIYNFRGELVRALVFNGCKVTAFASGASEDEINKIKALGADYFDYPVSRSGLNPLEDIKTFLFLKRKFNEIKPDSVLAYTIKPVIWGLAARLSGIKEFYALVTGLGFAFQKGSFLKNTLMGIEKSIIPPGYLALGYVQLGFLGDIGRRFYLSFFSSVHKSKVAEFYIAFMCANSFYHGDFRIFVMSLFFPMIFSLILKNMVIKNVK